MRGYRTLDSSNPSCLWLIPSAPVFKKWFITGKPASLSPAPALLRGAITVRSTELGLPASDQTPVCFYRCSTARSERPPATASRAGKGRLQSRWRKGCSPFQHGTTRSAWQQYLSAKQSLWPCAPHHTTLTLLPAAGGAASRTLACVFATPPHRQGRRTAAARRAAHGAVNHEPGGKEKRALQGSAVIYGYHLEKQ